MEEYDPLKTARKQEFPKELKNIGIDKEAIIKGDAPKQESVPAEPKKEPAKPIETKTRQPELESLASQVQKQSKMIDDMDARLKNLVANVNNVLTDFHNKIEELKRTRPQDRPPEKPVEKQNTLKPKEAKDKLEPGDIAIEDYFNYSNAKFK